MRPLHEHTTSAEVPGADDKFEALLQNPALKTLFGPRMVTNGVSTVREYIGDMRRYTSRDQVAAITCPSYITDNETDVVSTGQGQELYDQLTCPKAFRRFLQAEGAEGHCEGMAPVVFWAAAFDSTTRCVADQHPRKGRQSQNAARPQAPDQRPSIPPEASDSG